jgi:pyrroline-5-carboxylate reductase
MSVIVCIGSGNMAFALMKSVSANDPGASIFFTDIDIEKGKVAADAYKAEAIKSNIEAAKKGDFIFLAVKPQVLPQVLAEIMPSVKERLSAGSPVVLISMAAGWSLEKIQDAAGAKLPVVRIMPNTPALIGKGMIAIAASPEVPADKLADIENILAGAGVVDKLDEHYMDAVTGLSGSAPAFVYLFIEALADGGVVAGLPRDKALKYAAQTVLGAAAMVQETGKHPGELKAMVTSPGGTTIAGITALEEGAFRSTVIKAVTAAWQRSCELG